MLLHSKVAEIVVRFNLGLYRPCIIYSKKRVPILYVHLAKALCGMLRAALLFYKRPRKDLKTLGLKLIRTNPV